MPQADGSIRIDTQIETKNAEKEYQKLVKTLEQNVAKSSNKVTQLNNKFNDTRTKLAQVNAEMDELARKIAQQSTPAGVDASSIDNFITSQIQADKTYRALNAQAEKLEMKSTEYARDLAIAKENLAGTKLELDKVTATQNKAQASTNKFARSLKNIQVDTEGIRTNTKGIADGISGGIKKITRYGMALLSIRSIYGLLSNVANTWLNSNSAGARKLKADIDYMKNAVGQALSPVIQYMVNLLYEALGLIGALVKVFTGMDIFAGSYSDYMQSAYDSASGTTKELKKQLASFDKINKMEDTSSSGGGGGAGAIAPNQDLSNTMQKYMELAEKIKANFGEIKDLAIGIGIAIAGWKLAKMLNLSTGLSLGLALTASSLYFTWSGVKGFQDGEITSQDIIKALAGTLGTGVGAGIIGSALGLGLSATVPLALTVMVAVGSWVLAGYGQSQAPDWVKALIGDVTTLGNDDALMNKLGIPKRYNFSIEMGIYMPIGIIEIAENLFPRNKREISKRFKTSFSTSSRLGRKYTYYRN